MFRSRVVTLALLVALLAPAVLLTTPSVIAAPLRQVDAGAAIDLAWLAPVPADLTDGYGIASGVYRTAADTPGSVFGAAGPPGSFDEALTDAGARQTYWRRLVLRSEDDPDLYARSIDSLLTEFGDEAEAEDGLAAVHNLLATDFDELRTPPAVGDEAVAFRGEFTDPNQGAYNEVRVVTRTGRILIDLSLWDFTGDAPSASEVVLLAGVLVERVAAAEPSASAESPALAGEVPRLTGEDVGTPSDYYTRKNGEEIRTDGVSTSQLRSTTQFFDDIGNTDRYFYFASTVPSEDDDQPYVSSLVELYRFADEDSADAYLETVAENWVEARSAPYHDAEIVDDAEEFGDGSAFASYVYDYDWGTVPGYHFWLRVGDQFASVEMDGDPALSLADAEQMAEAQVACLEDGGCAEPLTVSELSQGNSGASPADTPEAGDSVSEPTAEPTEEPTDQTAATETYMSPSFGYTLSYDPTQWTLAEGPSTDADGVDTIGLSAGFSTLYLSGIPSALDAQTCVQIMTDAQTSEANVVAFEPLLHDAGVPDPGGEAGDAYATTRITRVMEDGPNVGQAFYTRCIALPSVGAVLAIQQFAAELIYDSALAQREQLLEGLTLP